MSDKTLIPKNILYELFEGKTVNRKTYEKMNRLVPRVGRD